MSPALETQSPVERIPLNASLDDVSVVAYLIPAYNNLRLQQYKCEGPERDRTAHITYKGVFRRWRCLLSFRFPSFDLSR